MVLQLAIALFLVFTIILQAGNFQTHTTAYFRIKYEKNVSTEEIQKLGELMEAQYTEMRNNLNITLSHRIDVFVFGSPRRFRSESKSKAFEDGDFQAGKIFLYFSRDLEKKQFLKSTISRVVSRSLLDEIHGCPEWLKEAYALYLSNELDRFGQPARVTMRSFADLSEDYFKAERDAEVRELYAKLSATAYFLVQHYGDHKVTEMFSMLKRGMSMEEAFETAFGESITEIEKAWVKALRMPISK